MMSPVSSVRKRPLLSCLAAGLLAVLLSGCGSYYTVSVDSLRDDGLAAGADAYFLEPGDESVSEDDLLFREIARMLEPAFLAQGYRVVSDRSQARGIARISYWEEEPITTLETGTTQRSVPVVVRDKKNRKHVEYVSVDEPTVTTRTIYTAKLLIETYASKQGGTGKQIWRTSVACSGSAEDFRTLLASMAPVLPRILGTQTYGVRKFEVFVEDSGKISVDEIGSGRWWP